MVTPAAPVTPSAPVPPLAIKIWDPVVIGTFVLVSIVNDKLEAEDPITIVFTSAAANV